MKGTIQGFSRDVLIYDEGMALNREFMLTQDRFRGSPYCYSDVTLMNFSFSSVSWRGMESSGT